MPTRARTIGANHYTVTITVPADTTYTAAFGTARVVSIGQIKEVKLQAKSAADPRPPVVPTTLINTVVQHTYKDVVLSGALQPRRVIVSNDKCNVCHGALGATSGSNTLASAFHSGARNTVEACVVCHDANRVSSTVMTSGTWPGCRAQRVLPDEAHDPRHPWQLEADVSVHAWQRRGGCVRQDWQADDRGLFPGRPEAHDWRCFHNCDHCRNVGCRGHDVRRYCEDRSTTHGRCERLHLARQWPLPRTTPPKSPIRRWVSTATPATSTAPGSRIGARSARWSARPAGNDESIRTSGR